MRVGRNVAHITIRDKEFDISITPSGAIIRWGEIVELGEKLNSLAKDVIKEYNDKDINPARYQELIELINLPIDDTIFDILAQILEHPDNGYVFDKDWWEEISEVEVRRFIEECIKKDGKLTSSRDERVDWDGLYTSLCKFWKPITWKELFQMDMIDIRYACRFIPKDIFDRFCITKKRQAFEVY